MKITKHSSYTATVEVNGEDIELALAVQPSSIVGAYSDPEVREVGDLLVFGYLADDSDCQNPLEGSDGMGVIYSALRHAGREDYEGMQAALGLDQDWAPNIGLDSVEVAAEAQLRLAVRDRYAVEYAEFALERMAEGKTADEIWAAFFHGYIQDYNRDTFPERVGSDLSWETLCKAAWRELRIKGEVGDPYMVMLDCYEHGGISWSTSGQGMQDQWDTSRGAGVWVPDDVLREELDALRKGTGGLDAAKEQAIVYAKEALNEYNEWLAGNCYGVIVNTYAKIPDGYELVDEDSCWGFIGLDYANSVVAENVTGAISRKQAAAA